MTSLLEKIKSGVLWDFPGGVYPPSRKQLTKNKTIQRLPLAETYYVPVKQHIGSVNSVCVAVGDRVLKGQALSIAEDWMALPIHAPTSGTIKAIQPHVSAHPSGIAELTIEITADGLDETSAFSANSHFHTLSHDEIIHQLQQAGISGLGGASFPTHVKQSANAIELLLINGVECEPYITADDQLMQEHANEIIHGIEVLAHLLQPKLVVIAIEDNKPEAIAALDKAAENKQQYIVRKIPTKYPAGGEKQLIQVLTGQEVPSGKHPVDLGIVSQNVGTCFAIYKAIYHGEPLIERVVTLTGESLEKPANYWLPIGTPIAHILKLTGYQANDINAQKLIMGGPMMGFSITNEQVPITKLTNCIIAPDSAELPDAPTEQACIRCSDCADVCPASLLPQQLYWHSKAKENDKAKALNLFDCIECGACSFVCPSDIPLVQYYRQSKAEIRNAEAEQLKSENAKQRFEARAERLEKEKQARLDKHKQAAEQRKLKMQQDPAAQDKVAAALARVQAKKAAQSTANEITNEIAPSVENTIKSNAQAAIERAKAKRLAKQAQSTTEQETTTPPSETENLNLDGNTPQVSDSAVEKTSAPSDTQSKAKAAIERAKAKRLAKQAQSATEQDMVTQPSEAASLDDNAPQPSDTTPVENANTPSDTQSKAKAAIERAKAKRLAKQAQSTAAESEVTETPATDASVANGNKSRAQIAIERAKAKRLKNQNEQLAAVNENTTNKTTELSETNVPVTQQVSEEAKAAIARAKARRIDKPKKHKTPIAVPDKTMAEPLTSDSKTKARAAIERAKARRVKSDNDPSTANSEHEIATDPEQKSRIKAAIAKANAKKEQN